MEDDFVQALEGRLIGNSWNNIRMFTINTFSCNMYNLNVCLSLCICDIHKLPLKRVGPILPPNAKVHDIIDIHAITMNAFSYNCVLFGCTLVTYVFAIFVNRNEPMLN